MVRNKNGETGLVPKNYVQTLTTDEKLLLEKNSYDSLKEPNSKLSNKTWYYGAISRTKCDQLLNEFGKFGDFLVRDSETNAGDFSGNLTCFDRSGFPFEIKLNPAMRLCALELSKLF